MKEPKEKIETVVRAPLFEPFPETNTMPSGWDLSGLIPDTQPGSTSPTNQNVDINNNNLKKA
jgi:hypothetical protein